MLAYLLNASPEEREAFSRSLNPSLEDCRAVFTEQYANKIFRQQKTLRRQNNIVIKPLTERQTTYTYWVTDADELKEYEGAAKAFPGGYRELARELNPSLDYVRFKFIEPGHKLGSAYDMLVYVNGHWVMIFRPWAVMF